MMKPMDIGVDPGDRVDIAIVGGGVSGVLLAYHLLGRTDGRLRVVIIDPRASLGLGLAYSTPSIHHLLNVPAGKISALPDRPDHFLRWLQANHDASATAETFAPRSVFGRYIQSLLTERPGFEHLLATAVGCRAFANHAAIELAGGRTLRAGHVVLATGNFNPAPLTGVQTSAIARGRYRHNAWTTDTYVGLEPTAAVTLIGTGLTAVDVLQRLRELGHRGVITAVSRHGVFPNRHDPHEVPNTPAILPGPEPTCLAYLRALRAAIRGGLCWRAAVDSLRATTNDLWLALPLDEQKRFRRHLQRRWDVVRHRMAPSVANLLDAEETVGTLVRRRGHMIGVEIDAAGRTIVTISTAHGNEAFETARVINCTGPSMNYRKVNSPLLDSLFAAGTISPGPLGGGLRSDAAGALLDVSGTPSRVLSNIGPGRLGTLLESIAVPELRQQAVELAARLAIAPTARDRVVA